MILTLSFHIQDNEIAIFDVQSIYITLSFIVIGYCVFIYRYGIVVNRLSKIQINFTEGHVLVSEPTDFLSSAVLVTGALLISQGDCFIQKEISMNVSITKETSKSE